MSTLAPAPAGYLGSLRRLVRAYGRHQDRDPRTVAVVGNAPLPPSADRASRVDGCDLVVRANGFLLDRPSAPPLVGSRCDVGVLTRGFHATPYVFEGYPGRLFLLYEPELLHGGSPQVPLRWPGDLGVVHLPNQHVTVPMCDDMGLPVRTAPRWPTTGATAVWLAATLFPQAALLLTGFSFVADPDQKRWAHAIGLPGGVPAVHQLHNEAAYVKRLVAAGRAHLLP